VGSPGGAFSVVTGATLTSFGAEWADADPTAAALVISIIADRSHDLLIHKLALRRTTAHYSSHRFVTSSAGRGMINPKIQSC
jgi:hypothetical protein